MKNRPDNREPLIRMINLVLIMVVVVLVLLSGLTFVILIGQDRIAAWQTPSKPIPSIKPELVKQELKSEVWQAPDVSQIPKDENGKLIEYGRELIAHTSKYLGPKGIVKVMSNGMNCQNCHLDGGTKPFGNNYSAVASTYPKFRARSGTEETIEKRVNDCLERSLNGSPLKNQSNEMRAIVAYIKWLGKEVEKGKSPLGSGLVVLPYLDRPASPENGKLIYNEKCLVCHGKEGEGIVLADSTGYQYPPLWGANSYNIGAGLFRISRFAGYVKANMPFGATYETPQLTDEEAWDVAAYVNSLSRPEKDLINDWPDISRKPFDHPFGPFTDGFDDKQHKFGPFKPIEEKRKSMASSK